MPTQTTPTAMNNENTENCYTLADNEREELRAVLTEENRSGFDRKNPNFASAMRASNIPVEKIRKQLFETEEPFFILKNLPVDQPKTKFEVSEAPYASAILAGLTASVGLRNFGYYEEKKGAILHDVFPIAGEENKHSNSGRIEFGYHVDNPFLPRIGRPEVLALISINNDAMTATHLMTVGKFKEFIPKETLAVLRESIFDFRHADSFDLNGYRVFATGSPTIKNVDGYDEIRCAVFTVSENDRAKSAIADFKQAAATHSRKIVLKPGELLIFNNHRCVHGRGEVGGWRWLKRIYGTRDDSLIDERDQMSVWNILSSKEVDRSF